MKVHDLSHLQGKFLCMCYKVSPYISHPLALVSLTFELLETADLAKTQPLRPAKAAFFFKKILYIGTEEKDTPADEFCATVMSGSNIYVAGSVFYRDTDILNNVISIDMSKSVIVPRHFGQIDTPMSNPLMVEMGGGKIYALAGWSSVFPDNPFAFFDPKEKTWTGLKPPPFYSFHTSDYHPEAAVVLNGQLHVSTRFDAFRFVPKKQKWKKSNLFDECPVQRIQTHSLPQWTVWFKNIKAAGKPFPFNVLGIALLNGQMLIGYSDTDEGHVAFRVKNWKVVDVQFLSSCGVNHDGELESPPRYVDLGNDYFSIFWYRHNYNERSFLEIQF